MDEKEMREEFLAWANTQDLLMPISASDAWKAACAWMMGKTEPVYQSRTKSGWVWMDMLKGEFDALLSDVGVECRILYTAQPMQNTERQSKVIIGPTAEEVAAAAKRLADALDAQILEDILSGKLKLGSEREIVLPELPSPYTDFNGNEMEAYARSAVKLDRKGIS